jgi:inhibitor of the pro-sigma K processing machinery
MARTKVIVIGPALVIILLLLVIIVAMSSPGWLIGLLVNGVIGVVILVILNTLFKSIEVPINIWTFLIAALGGLLGVLILVLLNLMGMKEW